MKALDKKTIRHFDPSVKWVKVDAIGIEKIAYDFLHKNLYVKFRKNENVYMYFGVEKEKYEKLMVEEHKTTFLNKEIKGNYEYDAYYEK